MDLDSVPTVPVIVIWLLPGRCFCMSIEVNEKDPVEESKEATVSPSVKSHESKLGGAIYDSMEHE